MQVRCAGGKRKKTAWKNKHSKNHRCLLLADFFRTPKLTIDLSDIDSFSLVSKRWTIPLKFSGADGCYERLFTRALIKFLACFFSWNIIWLCCWKKQTSKQHWGILLRQNKYSGWPCLPDAVNHIVSVWKADSALVRFPEKNHHFGQ